MKKKILSVCVIVAMLLVQLQIVYAEGTTFLIDNDFEAWDGTASGLPGENAINFQGEGAGFEVSDGQSGKGIKLSVTDSKKDPQATYRYYNNLFDGKVIISADFKSDGTEAFELRLLGTSDDYMTDKSNTSVYALRATAYKFDKDGYLKVGLGTSYTGDDEAEAAKDYGHGSYGVNTDWTCKYISDQWYRVDYIWDTANYSFEMYLNGEKIKDGFIRGWIGRDEGGYYQIQKMNGFKFQAADGASVNGSAVIDNLYVAAADEAGASQASSPIDGSTGQKGYALAYDIPVSFTRGIDTDMADITLTDESGSAVACEVTYNNAMNANIHINENTLSPDTAYNITISATDILGKTVSDVISFTTASTPDDAQYPPTISITSPVNGAKAVKGDDVTLAVDTDGGSGTVSYVEYYCNGELLSTVNEAPFGYTISAVDSGIYSICAKAVSDLGLSSVSDSVTVTVENTVSTMILDYPAVKSYENITVADRNADNPNTVMDSYVVFNKGAQSGLNIDLSNSNVTEESKKFEYEITAELQYGVSAEGDEKDVANSFLYIKAADGTSIPIVGYLTNGAGEIKIYNNYKWSADLRIKPEYTGDDRKIQYTIRLNLSEGYMSTTVMRNKYSYTEDKTWDINGSDDYAKLSVSGLKNISFEINDTSAPEITMNYLRVREIKEVPMLSGLSFVSGGETTADALAVPSAVEDITASFDQAMDADSFDGNVSVVKASDGSAVDFIGSYDQNGYRIDLGEVLEPSTQYKVSFGTGIKSAKGVNITSEQTAYFTTYSAPFDFTNSVVTVNGESYSGGAIPAGAVITGVVTLRNSTGTVKNGAVILAVYNSEGSLVNASFVNKTFNKGLTNAEVFVTRTAAAGSLVKIMVWEGMDSMKPLASFRSF